MNTIHIKVYLQRSVRHHNNHHKISITLKNLKYICIYLKAKLQGTAVDNNLLKQCILKEI